MTSRRSRPIDCPRAESRHCSSHGSTFQTGTITETTGVALPGSGRGAGSGAGVALLRLGELLAVLLARAEDPVAGAAGRLGGGERVLRRATRLARLGSRVGS